MPCFLEVLWIVIFLQQQTNLSVFLVCRRLFLWHKYRTTALKPGPLAVSYQIEPIVLRYIRMKQECGKSMTWHDVIDCAKSLIAGSTLVTVMNLFHQFDSKYSPRESVLICYSFVRFWNVTYRCHLDYSTKITWRILIYIIMKLQVQNINYDKIYYILDFFWTPKFKNWVNKRYLNTISCVTKAENVNLSYLRKNALLGIHFYFLYKFNS